MEELEPLALLAFFGLFVIVLLAIPGFLLHRVRIPGYEWKPVLAKALIAVAAWLVLSLMMAYLNFVFVFASAHTSPEARGAVMPILTLFALTIAYGLAGWGLCFLVKSRSTNESTKLN